MQAPARSDRPPDFEAKLLDIVGLYRNPPENKVVAHVRDRRTTVDFLSFMAEVIKVYPVGELDVVLDNLNIHKNDAVHLD
ncbi:MAG: hypothetical protein WA324_30885 [Bryobacteraceae bacterium]